MRRRIMRRRIWFLGAAVLALIALGAAWTASGRTQHQTLLIHATKIVPPFGYYGWYGWASSHEILLCTGDMERPFVTRYDTRGNRVLPNANLPRGFGSALMRVPFQPRVSPDGKWL